MTKPRRRPPWDPGPRAERGGRGKEGEGRIGKGKGGRARVSFSAKSWGYSAFQYIPPDLTPKTNRELREPLRSDCLGPSGLGSAGRPAWSGGNALKTVFSTLTFARFVARAVALHVRFVSAHEWRTLTVLDGHSRTEWPVAWHVQVLHTRYGLGTNLSRTTYSNFKVWHAELPDTVRCESAPQLAQTIACMMRYDLIRISLISLFKFAAAFKLLGPPLPGPYLLTQRPCLDLPALPGPYEKKPGCHARAG